MVDDTDEAADMRIARHIIGVHCHGFHAFDTVPYKTDAIQRCAAGFRVWYSGGSRTEALLMHMLHWLPVTPVFDPLQIAPVFTSLL